MTSCSYRLPKLGSALLLATALTLTACDGGASRKPAKALKPQQEYQAADYVQSLSLASLRLTPDSSEDAAASLKVVEAYTAKPAKKKAKRENSVAQKVAVLECANKDEGKRKRQVLAPLGARSQENLNELLTLLRQRSCTLHNVWPARVSVKRNVPLGVTSVPAAQAEQVVSEQLEVMVQKAERYSPLEEARAQMEMIRIFIDNRQRDAAYIAVENAKQSLAAAESSKPDKATVHQLLKDLEVLETELRVAMPFTL